MKGITIVKWTTGIILAILIKWISSDNQMVETWYSRGIYPPVAATLRILFGWLPFSIGDFFYGAVLATAIIWLYRWGRNIVRRQLPERWGWIVLKQAAGFALILYVLFYSLWGLNYFRIGVRAVMPLEVKAYETEELKTVMHVLAQKLNAQAEHVVEKDRDSLLKISYLEKEVLVAYKNMAQQYPGFAFSHASLKKSLIGNMGNYLGFSGYLNPFTNEAHLNRTIPLFYQPSVACHEVAHQVGFSSETEANFVGYLSCKASSNRLLQYSIYYDMVFYGLRELRRRDSTAARVFMESLHPQVRKDRAYFRRFLEAHKSPVGPMVESFYDAYLRANEQASGIHSYDEVIGLLMAYYRKYGVTAL